MNIFKDLIDNQFNCNRNNLVDNGVIFYFNSQNGTKFDWYNNNHISTLAAIYPDGTEAVKVLIYNDGNIQVYYYKKGSMKPDNELTTKISKETAKEIAIILYTISDKKGLFDKRLNELDICYKLTSEDIINFENDLI
jgi:hypothetical protein